MKLGDLRGALQSFEKALELAKILEDEAAENAISKALSDVNERLSRGKKANGVPVFNKLILGRCSSVAVYTTSSLLPVALFIMWTW